MNNIRDWHTKDGAEHLAGVIRTFWQKRGRTVNVRIEIAPFCMRMREQYYVIRSDIGAMLGPKGACVSTAKRLDSTANKWRAA